MKSEVCWWIPDCVLVIFRVVTTIECPGAFAVLTMNVAGLIGRLVFAHNKHACLQYISTKRCSLAHEAFDSSRVILTQHAWHRIELGRESKKGEVVQVHRYSATVLGAVVYSGVLVGVRCSYE